MFCPFSSSDSFIVCHKWCCVFWPRSPQLYPIDVCVFACLCDSCFKLLDCFLLFYFVLFCFIHTWARCENLGGDKLKNWHFQGGPYFKKLGGQSGFFSKIPFADLFAKYTKTIKTVQKIRMSSAQEGINLEIPSQCPRMVSFFRFVLFFRVHLSQFLLYLYLPIYLSIYHCFLSCLFPRVVCCNKFLL